MLIRYSTTSGRLMRRAETRQKTPSAISEATDGKLPGLRGSMRRCPHSMRLAASSSKPRPRQSTSRIGGIRAAERSLAEVDRPDEVMREITEKWEERQPSGRQKPSGRRIEQVKDFATYLGRALGQVGSPATHTVHSSPNRLNACLIAATFSSGHGFSVGGVPGATRPNCSSQCSSHALSRTKPC